MTRKIFILMIVCVFGIPQAVQASEKSWTGSGDGSDWSDDDNWYPAAVPTSADDVLIDTQSADVDVSRTFNAKSIMLGGTAASALTVDQIVFGTVAPAEGTDVAFHNRRGGTWVLKGSMGTVTLKGKYKDSEEVLASQPSLVFFVE